MITNLLSATCGSYEIVLSSLVSALTRALITRFKAPEKVWDSISYSLRDGCASVSHVAERIEREIKKKKKKRRRESDRCLG